MLEDDRTLTRRLTRRRHWARLMLRAEAALSAFAPALLVVGVFLIFSLVDGWAQLPWWLHLGGLAGSLVLLAWNLWLGWRRFVPPDAASVDRRLEAAATLEHQPMQALADRPAGDADAATARLWSLHQQRQRRALERIRYVGTRPVLARRDPWAVRVGLALVLVIAAIDAGPAWRERLAAAFLPQPAAAVAPGPARVDLWLTPPLYTGEPPIVRSITLPLVEVAAPLVVPSGSELVVQLHAPAGRAPGAPHYGLEPLATETLGEGSVEARTVIRTSGALQIGGDGETAPEASFPIEVLPDHAPIVRFVETPRATHRGVLNPRFEASDDYGLASVALDLALAVRPEATERIEMRQLGRPMRELEDSSYLDLTPHPFAGQEVVARLVARDVAEQEGTSAEITFVLPERTFDNVLARAIIAARKQLVAEPSERRGVASQLNIMAQSPRLDGMELAIPLTLRAASTRLVLNDEGEADRSVVDLLWELALYIEEGQLAVAERSLRELERALQEALDRGADAEELDRLMNELEQALNEFLEQMQRQAMEQLQNMQPGDRNFQPLDPNAQVFDQQDFQEMLEQMREAMEAGAGEQAQQMLSQMRQLLENLQMAMQMPMLSPMQQNMGALQDLIRRQQDLLDRSFEMQQSQQGQPGQPSQQGQQGQPGQQGQMSQQGQGQGQGSQGLGSQQEALRRALGDVMRQLGEQGQGIPRALGQSELQMRGAEQALNEGQPGQAVGPQTEALDLMQQGAGQLMEQLQQQMQMGQQPGQPGPNAGMGPPLTETRDPLGRPLRNDGGASPYGVEVPDQPDLGTAREVLRELHRRAGEQERPALELEYFERLLRRF